MTIRTCLAKHILALCFISGAMFAAGSRELAGLAQAYRDTPNPIRRAALASYGAAHQNDTTGPLARLALGVAEYEQKNYAEAIAALEPIQSKLPQIADYAAYYLAAARVELSDAAADAAMAVAAVNELSPVHSSATLSPLSGKAWLVEARARQTSDPAAAARLLRDHYAELPQPDGDLTLAACYQAGHDFAHAADFYQRVCYRYVTGDAATRAAAALVALKDLMGADYPAPLPEQVLRSADRLMDLHEYAAAKAQYEAVLDQLPALEHEQALVRIGGAGALGGNANIAWPYLRDLVPAAPAAAAERLYYLEECARRLNNDEAMMAAVKELGE